MKVKVVSSYKELVVWQKSIDLVEAIYRLTRQLPKSETFGLASQMQRSAVSIPSNVAEGSKRSSRADYRQFLLIALGSNAELETQLEIVRRIYKIDIDECQKLTLEVQKMLQTISSKLKS